MVFITLVNVIPETAFGEFQMDISFSRDDDRAKEEMINAKQGS